MCNERDRLIAYIYNECDAGERGLVQQHLDTCDECRVEVAGLRSVREDLLSWDVPVHESVWRPFAPAPVTTWWKQVPAWAMAAAAGIVVLSGAAGGAALHAFMPESPAVRQADQTSPAPAVAANPTLTGADLSAAEQRLLARLRTEVGAVDARVRQASLQTSEEPLSQDHAALNQEVVSLRERNRKLEDVVDMFVTNLDQVSKAAEIKNGEFQNKLNNLQSIVQQLVQGLQPIQVK